MSIGRIGGVVGGDTILETYRFNASGGETSLSGTDAGGKTLVYPANYEAVFLNGVRLVRGVDYTATTGSSITGLAALTAGDVVEIAVFQNLDVVSVDYADVRFAADEPSNPVNGTIWIESDATVNVENFIAQSLLTDKGQIVGASASGTPVAVPAASADGQLLVSDSTQTSGVAFSSTTGNIVVSNSTATAGVTCRGDGQSSLTSVERYDNTTGAPTIQMLKARGSASSPVIVNSGDFLGLLRWFGHDGTAWREAARIETRVDGTPGASDMPGRLQFSTTADGSATITERMRIDSEGRVRIYGGVLEAPIVQNAQSDSYTLVLADAGKMIEMGKATAQTLTIPTNSSVAFPVGTKIDVLQTGAGQVTIAGASGVTVNSTPGLKISAQWGAASLVKRAENTWVAIGNLSA